MARKTLNRRTRAPLAIREWPLFEEFYKSCPTARYVGGTSVYLCECKSPGSCSGAMAADAAIRRYREQVEMKEAQNDLLRTTRSEIL